MTTTPPTITLDDVRDAAARLKGVAHRTPVLRSRTLDALVGAEVLLKCENFQRVGAFKFRGAYNAASRLAPEQLARGIAAYSSGNHAQAVALAARELGTTAVIVMPEDAPGSKRAATEGYGAEIVTYDRYTEDRVAVAEALAADRGLALIPPYEHPHVMAGQGTAALELLEEAGELDALLVPVGGGGLIMRQRDRGQGAAAGHPDRRCGTGGRGRHQTVAGGGPTGRDPGAAHHRRRPGPAHTGGADLLGEPAARGRHRPGLRRRDPRGHAVRLRTPEDRRGAERRHPARRPPLRAGRLPCPGASA